MIEVRESRKATSKLDGLWVILQDRREIGFLTRYANSKRETHPWKAFRGIGMSAEYLGAYYSADGGKRAAIAAVVENRAKEGG